MLKRLELIGFKSFAEKTRFDFPAGVTAIVGPNGSGKSNIVDAVRWILGEQSAKNLRGGEMADVIFNGSSSRKSLGMAEVTMTFDNSRRILNLEADEVQITRRVYRDGTGEYLINHQPSRLKDIKEMFLGSGAGTTAYCIIEQGRVDALLQASTRDRRIIFEEAAGISRFKAKKTETLRKLEHVEQNLARSRDIAAEVDKQRRRLDIEASKARRFQEYSGRLKELRVGLGLREYAQYSEQYDAERHALELLRSSLSDTQLRVAAWELEAGELEVRLASTEAQLQSLSVELADTHQRIAGLQSTSELEYQSAEATANEIDQARLRKLELARLVRLSEQAVQDAHAEVTASQEEATQARNRVDKLLQEVAEVDLQINALQQQIQNDRSRQVDLVRQAGTLQTQTDAHRQQLDRLFRDREQRRRRTQQREAERGSLDRVLEELTNTDANLQQRLVRIREDLSRQEQAREVLRHSVVVLQNELEGLRVQRSELRGRIEILEGLERSQEGLGTGVREVMHLLAAEQTRTDPKDGLLRLSDVVIGLVADHLSVPRELAPLVDLAIGDTAQKFIIRDSALLDTILAQLNTTFSGRVSFLPLQALSPLAEGDETATADRWVTCEHPELKGLPRQLLGNVHIVDDRFSARIMSVDPAYAGVRYVTRDGELIEPDGTLTVGKHHSEGGILSRKSELRDLRVRAAQLENDIAAAEQRLSESRQQIAALEAPIHGLEQEIELLNNQAGDLLTRIVQHREQRTRLEEELVLQQAEMNLLEQEIQTLEAAWLDARQRAEEAERNAQELRGRLEEAERLLILREEDRQRLRETYTVAQVSCAQLEERLAGLRKRSTQLEDDLRRGKEEFHRIERHLALLEARRTENQLAVLRAGDALAEQLLLKQVLDSQIRELTERRETDRERRRMLQEELQAVRHTSQDQITRLHAHELRVRDLENARSTLVDRLKEDYQFDLAEEYAAYQRGASQNALPEGSEEAIPPEDGAAITDGPSISTTVPMTLEAWNSAEVQAEIHQLREKIRRLGNVSMESLQELEEVERRATELQTQLDDLASAQGSLLEIITKINADSRRMFAETYDTIRTHFQELFRKMFGGGMADIILENPEDVLESGIEILARPPGKELRSISLMSGGEKTMTAVALLLAIFRSRPSPFCLLDEVDAALDEANTTRLGSVLREFLDRSQFIIITHKKRTMAIADVLYGITMQESGVSKLVAVRFEDWPEDPAEQAAAA